MRIIAFCLTVLLLVAYGLVLKALLDGHSYGWVAACYAATLGFVYWMSTVEERAYYWRRLNALRGSRNCR